MDDIRVNSPALPEPTAAAKRASDVTHGASARTDAATSAAAVGAGAKESTAVADSARIAGVPSASLGQLLPISVLRSPTLMRTEWAWRRLIVDALMQMLTDASADHQVVLEKSLQSLWDHLDFLANSASQAPKQTTWQGKPPVESLQSFANLKADDILQLNRAQQAVVLLDRLQAATTTQADPRLGGGFFFPQVPAAKQNHTEVHQAVRWHAERQTRVTSAGQIVYRLKLNIEVSGRPVEVTFLSAKPTLAIHIKTDDHHLRRRIETPNASILGTLHSLGWQVNNWSAGDSDDSAGVNGESGNT